MKVSHPHSNLSASRRTHDLRHTCATLLLEEGVELVTIKELLGHAQLHVTADIYAHVRPRLKRNAIEAMNRALHDDEDDNEPDTSNEDDTGDDETRTAKL